MTCIVGIVKQGKVFIGGDSAGVAGLDVVIRKDSKVFKVKDFVIGCTSSFRMIQLIRYSFNPPEKLEKTDVFQYMCTAFIDALRQCLKQGGFAETERGAESGGTFLVGYKGRLFKIYSDYQVAESADLYDSCGCGQSFALGALDAMPAGQGKAMVVKALNVATKRSGGVRPPFVIESM